MPSPRVLVLALACLAGQAAQAQLFGDDQARQAILDLRQRFDQAVAAQNRLVDENTQQRRGLLDLQQQIESLRGELARSRGQEEQLARDVAELHKALASQQQALDERLRKLEQDAAARAPDASAGGAVPPVASDAAAATEKQDYDAALAVFRAGDSALFWLGNAQYATRDYKEAITNFRSLLTASPNHARAPEAMLAIANCQIELKDSRAARSTLESLIKTYPQSEAAQTGKERLARLK